MVLVADRAIVQFRQKGFRIPAGKSRERSAIAVQQIFDHPRVERELTGSDDAAEIVRMFDGKIIQHVFDVGRDSRPGDLGKIQIAPGGFDPVRPLPLCRR